MEQKKKVIKSTTYLVTQMDAIAALRVQTKLLKILGVGVLDLFLGDNAETIDAPKLISNMMDNFDDDAVFQLVISLFDKGVFVEVKGQPRIVDFATHFTGKAAEMWEVVGFIFEANFSGESSGSGSHTTEAQTNPTPEN